MKAGIHLSTGNYKKAQSFLYSIYQGINNNKSQGKLDPITRATRIDTTGLDVGQIMIGERIEDEEASKIENIVTDEAFPVESIADMDLSYVAEDSHPVQGLDILLQKALVCYLHTIFDLSVQH
jgi:hypothetical protein